MQASGWRQSADAENRPDGASRSLRCGREFGKELAMKLSSACTREQPSLVLNAQTAADLMTSSPVSLLQTATAREAACFLTDRGISAAPVINEAGAPVGVLSQTDLVVHDREKIASRIHKQGYVEDFSEFAEVPGELGGVWCTSNVEPPDDAALVRDLMTPTVFTVRLEASAAQVVEDMLALRVHRLFVVDDDGVLVGVITATDVLRRLGSATEYEG
jgi:CBS domain-containing protein